MERGGDAAPEPRILAALNGEAPLEDGAVYVLVGVYAAVS